MTTTAETSAETKLRTCAIGELQEAAYNPRRHFDEKQLADLVESIKAKGVINPILVRPVMAAGPAYTGPLPGKYEIVGGARRFRAARAAGLSEIPCIVRELTNQEALEVAVIDNLQRADVHPLDEAEGYAALLDHQDGKYDVAAIAAKVGKSTSFVYQRLKLADLIEPAKKAFWKDEITAGHAILIARLRPEDQKEAFDNCFAEYYGATTKHAVSTRELAETIEERILTDLNKAPWGKDDATLVEDAGACTACPKRTGSCPELFSEIKKGDRCLDRQCFAAKLEAFFDRRQEEAKKSGLPVVLVSPEYGCPPGVLKSDRWHKITNKKKCDKIAKGVIYSGGERGQIIDVCTGMRCPIHSGLPASYQRDPKEVQRETARNKKFLREAELHRAIFAHAVKKAPTSLSRETLVQVAIVLGREYGFDEVDTVLDYRHDPKKIAKLSDAELAQFITAHTLVDAYGHIDNKIAKTAQGWGVDVGEIEIALNIKWASDAKLEKDRLREKEKKGEKVASKAAKSAAKKQGHNEVEEE